ncbi:MAG TPA: MCE family protein [Nocardioidaceae bacterium]|nr:MCE family protein [Nocardioidaceae bacterium]
MKGYISRSPIPASFVKVTVFATITVMLIAVLATLIGNISFAESRTYYALFSDATGVNKGDRVRLSGVEVGSIRGLKIVDVDGRKLARLEFTVEESVPVYSDAKLQLRYENIVGQRYLAIAEQPGERAGMEAGDTFPVEQTTPALSLTELFNGFQPLFRALDPDRLNTFSYELVRALQGEAGSIQALMQDTASLTNTLADRDEVIGGVVSNLNTVLQTVGDRDEQLTALIVQFRNLMNGLAKDGDVIEASLPTLAGLLDSTTGFLTDVRPPLQSDLESLRVLSSQLYDGREELDAVLDRMPFKLRALARTGSYGSWFNFYVCGLGIELTLLDSTVNLGTPTVASNEKDTVCAGGTL